MQTYNKNLLAMQLFLFQNTNVTQHNSVCIDYTRLFHEQPNLF